jgi:hypothetical protein|tara:strand:+ start:4014 stop:4280 length:267 start_codon:yes stop_codon:yes gene_type:complete
MCNADGTGTFVKLNQHASECDIRFIPVLVLKYFPPDSSGTRLDSSVTGLDYELSFIQDKVIQMTAETVNTLTQGSIYHGYKDATATPS